VGANLPGVHGLERTYNQQSHYLRDMDDPNKKRLPKKQITADDLQKKIASLEKQLYPAAKAPAIQPGDGLIQGSFPGHAMIVMDVAENKKGEKIFMLAQSYMPAQDIHIVKNLHNPELSPWFELSSGEDIITPERKFTIKQLRTWQRNILF
jgi:hypothetical protein